MTTHLAAILVILAAGAATFAGAALACWHITWCERRRLRRERERNALWGGNHD